MKTLSDTLLRGLALVALFGLSSLAQAQTQATDRAGTVKTVAGTLQVESNGTRRALQPGDAIRANDRIVSGADGSGGITLRDGTVMTLGPNTNVALSRFRFDSTTQEGEILADLAGGTIRMITGLIARINPALVNVKTPTALVGVRGTDFIVEAR